jgi:hypothetical protein
MADDELENTIKQLIDRIRAAIKGSAEYEAAIRELGRLIETHENAGLIAEEYQSLLDTIEM